MDNLKKKCLFSDNYERHVKEVNDNFDDLRRKEYHMK